MPKRKSDEDIDDLMDEIDELEDEVEVEEDPDEAPAPRKRSSKKKSSKKVAAKKTREGIGTRELADEAGVEPRVLRSFLRNRGYQPRDDREGRYTWPSLNDPEAKQILKAVRDGELKAQQQEQLAKVKGRSKKATSKKKRSRAKASA